jgi:NAD(P)H-dependent FMN reductase
LLIDVMDPRIAFAGKKAALIGISTGRAGNLRGMDHLASVMNHMNVHVLPSLLPVSGVQHEMEHDSFKDSTLKVVNQQIAKIIAF